MAERESTAVQFYDAKVAPRKSSVTDMAGGTLQEPVLTEKSVPMYEVDERKSSVGDQISSEDDDDDDKDYEGKPTEEEKRSLRRVRGTIPRRAFLVAVVELAERFTYYGLSGPFQNYIQFPYPGTVDDGQLIRGAINGGQQEATGLNNFFQFWCYITPILGAVVADQYLGRYKTIFYSSIIYMIGNLILFCTSLPVAIEHGAALGGLIVSMIIIGIGTGGIKSNVSPLIAEQLDHTKLKVKTLKTGERVIVDPAMTVSSVYMIFYICINVGSLSSIATTELEQRVGFWPAYLLPMLMFIFALGVVVLGKNQYVQRPPQGSIIPNALKALWIGARNRNMDVARPSYQNANGNKYNTPWNDLFIEELKRALVACKVFAVFPIYWLVYNQMLNNFTSQAASMQLHGVPNDLLNNIDPLALIVFIPLVDSVLYPFLRKRGIQFKPVTRIFWGFMFGSVAMAYTAIVQQVIYNTDGNINVGFQTPAYFFIAISEIFASITGLEYAYTKAPASMKSFIMSMYLFTTALGSALALALTPVSVDPKLTWMYTGLAAATFITGVGFWFIFRQYNVSEDKMNELEGKITQAGEIRDFESSTKDKHDLEEQARSTVVVNA